MEGSATTSGPQSGGAVAPLPATSGAAAPFQFGAWQVMPALHRVSDGRREGTLEPRVMHVLVCLVAHPGEVVSRRELMDVVWREAVVGEEVLTRAVSLLRQLFGDQPQAARYIETIRGGGYRALAEVVPLTPGDRPPVARRRRWLAPLALTLLLVVVAAGAVWRTRREAPALLIATPLTAVAGREQQPRWDPDGRLIAYAFSRDGRHGIALAQSGAARPLVLTEGDDRDLFPAWSPDGTRVAFVRSTPHGAGILVVPMVGGVPRVVTALSTPAFGLDWLPDGSGLVFGAGDDSSRLYSVAVAGGVPRPLTTPDPATYTGDSQPRFSPDGKRLGFVRCDHIGLQELWLAAGAGGAAHQLSHGLRRVAGFDWTPDGQRLVVAAAPGRQLELWLVDAASGARKLLPLAALNVRWPTVAARGALAFTVRSIDTNIWRLAADAAEQLAVIASTRADAHPSLSPDGARLAFVSERSGEPQLWLANRDGGGLVLLTGFAGEDIGRPRWSPDGGRIAVSVTDDSTTRVHLVGVADHAAMLIGGRFTHEVVIGWTPDGESVVFEADTPVGWRFWRMRSDGSNAAELAVPEHGMTRVAVAGNSLDHMHGCQA